MPLKSAAILIFNFHVGRVVKHSELENLHNLCVQNFSRNLSEEEF